MKDFLLREVGEKREAVYPVIRLRQIKKNYMNGAEKITALHDVNLDVYPGEIFGVVGKSGAGKSSLIRCINMLERPTEGEVWVDGVNMTGLRQTELQQARKNIGMIFQHFNLLASRTVYENVALPLELAGCSNEEIKGEVTELLELVGLADKKDVYPARLSGGQKQRVGIARALATKPKILLCDEATSALDPQITQSILMLLQKIQKQRGLTIVLITHEMNVIKEICHRVGVLEQGKLVEVGDVAAVVAHPTSEVAREFMNARTSPAMLEYWKEQLREGNGASEIGKMVRLAFSGHSAGQPVIASLVRACNVEVNILSGTLEIIQGVSLGTLVVEITGEAGSVSRAMRFLEEHKVELEVMDNGHGTGQAVG